MNNITVICFAVVFIGVALSVASLATPHWMQFDFYSNFSSHAGLWTFCRYEYKNGYSCEALFDIQGALS